MYELAQLVRAWDPDRWRELIEQAASGGLPIAMRSLAYELRESAPGQAREWRDRLLETGDGREIERLATALGEENPDDARALDEAAAENGVPSSMRRLAVELVDSDPEQSRSWAQRLFAAGNAREIELLARDLRTRSPNEAIALFGEAADTGSSEALVQLALWPDEAVAESWWKRVVDSGDASAIGGVAQAVLAVRPETAPTWRDLAVDTGTPDTMRAVAAVLFNDYRLLAEQLRIKAAESDG
jgi:TPR repeat protein